MKTDCNHIIGVCELDHDGEVVLIHADQEPHSWLDFSPLFSFCPLCGAEVASLASEFQTSLDALLKPEHTPEPSTPPEKAFHEQGEKIGEWLKEIEHPPGRISALMEKGVLPEGLGYNYQPATYNRPSGVTVGEVHEFLNDLDQMQAITKMTPEEQDRYFADNPPKP